MDTGKSKQFITVIGAGVMGSAIAALVRGYGISVHLIDRSVDALETVPDRIGQQIRHAQLLSAIPSGRRLGDLTISDTIDANISNTLAVIEAITEHVDGKRDVLSSASELVDPGTPLISNTSGIPIDELARVLPRPGDLVGTHFMNPAYLIRMVEVIRGPQTAESVLTLVKQLLGLVNREPVVVRDAPGFVTSRLLHPMINEAARIVGAGVASVEAVDALMQGCLGHPTGPLRTADLIGIDNLVDALLALYERTGEEYFKPCKSLTDKVEQGTLGRKSGRGYYDY